jgi:hypothetical protein
MSAEALLKHAFELMREKNLQHMMLDWLDEWLAMEHAPEFGLFLMQKLDPEWFSGEDELGGVPVGWWYGDGE